MCFGKQPTEYDALSDYQLFYKGKICDFLGDNRFGTLPPDEQKRIVDELKIEEELDMMADLRKMRIDDYIQRGETLPEWMLEPYNKSDERKLEIAKGRCTGRIYYNLAVHVVENAHLARDRTTFGLEMPHCYAFLTSLGGGIDRGYRTYVNCHDITTTKESSFLKTTEIIHRLQWDEVKTFSADEPRRLEREIDDEFEIEQERLSAFLREYGPGYEVSLTPKEACNLDTNVHFEKTTPILVRCDNPDGSYHWQKKLREVVRRDPVKSQSYMKYYSEALKRFDSFPVLRITNL